VIEVNSQVLDQINKSFVIPPRPQLIVDLQELQKQAEPSIMDAAEIISKDVAISAAILKTINSPAFGLARTISDIKQAVMFIGLTGVFSLVQGLKLKQAFDPSKSCISLERFWDNAAEVAEVAMLIGNFVKSKVPIENLYTIGLFHDCGIPPMAIKFNDYVDALDKSNKDFERTLVDIEEKTYSTNHAVIGYYLANSWHLPKDICQLILRHHDLSLLDHIEDSQEQICFAVLKLAEQMVSSVRRLTPCPEWHHVNKKVLDILGIGDDELSDLKEDVEELILN
jgi:HD-like signal output (HDOD) protein